jgi:hypothetical protein
MRTAQITVPEIGLIAVTRALLGAGVGLLLADRLSARQRHAIGGTLLLVGLLSTVPLVVDVRSKLVRPAAEGGTRPEESERPSGAQAYASMQP